MAEKAKERSFCPLINGECKIGECMFTYQHAGNPKKGCSLTNLYGAIRELSDTVERTSRYQNMPK